MYVCGNQSLYQVFPYLLKVFITLLPPLQHSLRVCAHHMGSTSFWERIPLNSEITLSTDYLVSDIQRSTHFFYPTVLVLQMPQSNFLHWRCDCRLYACRKVLYWLNHFPLLFTVLENGAWRMESKNEADWSLTQWPTLFRASDILYWGLSHLSEVYNHKDKLDTSKPFSMEADE